MNVSPRRQPMLVSQNKLVSQTNKVSMQSQRLTLGIGLAILLFIGAASIGLDLKSRSDAASVDHTLAVLKKISEVRLLLRRAESAARGFALSGNPVFLDEYREAGEAVAPAFDDLIGSTRDNPAGTRLLENTKALVARRMAITDQLVRLKTAGDSAGITAQLTRAEGRAVME